MVVRLDLKQDTGNPSTSSHFVLDIPVANTTQNSVRSAIETSKSSLGMIQTTAIESHRQVSLIKALVDARYGSKKLVQASDGKYMWILETPLKLSEEQKDKSTNAIDTLSRIRPVIGERGYVPSDYNSFLNVIPDLQIDP